MQQNLESLVCCIVPAARSHEHLKNDLISHCHDILGRQVLHSLSAGSHKNNNDGTSHLGRNHQPDLGHLAVLIKRHLQQTSPSGASSLKFTNLLSRLLDQSVLSKKHASILFLQTLASSPQPITATSLLPSVTIPPPTREISIPMHETSNWPSKNKSKADLLRDYRRTHGNSHTSEALVLRDTLYLLQGISGKYLRFVLQEDPSPQEYVIFLDGMDSSISMSTKALIHRLSEIGYLYTRVGTFIRERDHAAGVGMIEQSLCHHLQTQLTEYYRLIAVLESQMSTIQTTETGNGEVHQSRENGSGLTLRRLDVWMNDWRLRMRMMSICVEGAKDTHGGALVNLIHGYTDNGDPFVKKFTNRLLEEVSKPFFVTLHRWLFSGELNDPFSEFFVAMDAAPAQVQDRHLFPNIENGGHLSSDGGFGGLNGDADDILGTRGGLRSWETKYRFQKDMLPMFVGEPFGRKIFSTGRSLNFIRYSCHDSDWVITREKMSNTGGTLQYSDIAGLERSIDAAYQIASQRLFEVFIEKFKLLDHLQALKNYLMLRHGDFADQLMDALGPNLARPANTLYRHNLTATLETAIRSSNAQNDPPDVLRRLDARMLEYSHGEMGWDVFTLEYKVDAPIDTILDPQSMEKYLKLFKHLWQMKRVEGVLNKGWMRMTGGGRSFLRIPEMEFEWHQIRILTAEMIHFIRQMQAYCHLEVIECSWKILVDFLNAREGDLDSLIDAHRAYLDRMVKKVLLRSQKVGKEDAILSQVLELFSVILQFREATDNFYNHCLSEASRRDQRRDTARGVYTGTDEVNQLQTTEALLARLKAYGATFSDRAQTIVQYLQVHPDLDCRFLGIRLSFSDFYRTRKEQQSQLQPQKS